MNVLFLTLVGIHSVSERGIYQDLLRKFVHEGHTVTIVTPTERRKKKSTNYTPDGNVNILRVKTFNITKTNLIEKGVGTLAIEYQYLSALKKYCAKVKFDLVLYSTPPITFVKVIEFIKKRDNAYCYLLLKDIFPQNAVDMGMIKKAGFIHKLFLKKEKKLYQISDTIGCMSQANVDFILKHNTEINPAKVEINPNSIEPIEVCLSKEEKNRIRLKYDLPLDTLIFIYGGNLGKPQGISFLKETIEKCEEKSVFFLVVGNGTEYAQIHNWYEQQKPINSKLIQSLTKPDYDNLLSACDVGLIFLDRNFKIPNFPSRLLSYLEMKMPVIAATDPNSDIGDVIEKAKCGYKVISGDSEKMNKVIHQIATAANFEAMRKSAWDLLQTEYLVDRSYNLIIQSKL
jgi:hypothetical protein